MNSSDIFYKEIKHISDFLAVNKIKFIIQLPNQQENSMKTGHWGKNYLLNNLIEKKVYTTSYYNKADKITETKNILNFNSNLSLFLFKFKIFYEINIFFAEPTIVPAEHGYDVFTRNSFVPIRIQILNDEEVINFTYLTILKYLYDADIYQPKN